MGRAIEVVAGFATNPGATLTTLTPSTGTSFTVRGTDTSKATWLIATNAFCATAGELRITSPRLHDQTQCIRNRVTAAFAGTLYGGHSDYIFAQRLYAQDNLTVQISGGGAELDCAALYVMYEDLVGVSGRYIDTATLTKFGVQVVTVEVTVTGVATGNFGGAVTINSTFENLIANTDYAIVGGMVDTRCTAVGILGVDLGNIKTGFPGEPSIRNDTANWFSSLSVALNGAPTIPVINSANKAATTIDVETNGAGGTFIVNLQCVQLAPNAVPQGAATAPGTQPK